jgi:hypothetical protein
MAFMQVFDFKYLTFWQVVSGFCRIPWMMKYKLEDTGKQMTV